MLLVLRNVDHKWRLFWIFEAIGISLCLALMAVTATGNAKSVNSDGSNKCPQSDIATIRCYVFDWGFFVILSPISVTIVSFLSSCAIARPAFFFRTLQERCFDLLVLSWIGHFFATASVGVQGAVYVDVVPTVCVLLCSLVYTMYNGNDVKDLLLQMWTDARKVSWRSARWLLVAEIVLLLYVHVWAFYLSMYKSDDAEKHWAAPVGHWPTALFAFLTTALTWWLLWGILATEAGNLGENPPLTQALALLWGWSFHTLLRSTFEDIFNICMSNGIENNPVAFIGFRLFLECLFTTLIGIEGVCVRAEKTRGIAFWAAATYFRDIVITWGLIWANARTEGTIN